MDALRCIHYKHGDCSAPGRPNDLPCVLLDARVRSCTLHQLPAKVYTPDGSVRAPATPKVHKCVRLLTDDDYLPSAPKANPFDALLKGK